jgi:hypothetical protein
MKTVILTMKVDVIAGNLSSLGGGMEKLAGAGPYFALAALFDYLHLFRCDAADRAIDTHNVSPLASLTDFARDFQVFACPMIPKSLPSDAIRGCMPVFGEDHAQKTC